MMGSRAPLLRSKIPLVLGANSQWEIIHVRERPYLGGYAIGWLVNSNSGRRYLWRCFHGHVTYMREPQEMRNIPKFVTKAITESHYR